MNQIYSSEMPDLNLSHQELKNIIQQLLSTVSHGFDFNGFTSHLCRHLIKTGKGFNTKSNMQYNGDLQQKDKAMVREIIWDLIIDRYISPGGNGHDQWPSLTVTARGKEFFASFKIDL